MRLFFNSIRYSEDIDLDAEIHDRDALRTTVAATLKNSAFLDRLKDLGIREVQLPNEIKKDSETTLRFNPHLVLAGGVSHRTAIDVRFRNTGPRDQISIEEANPDTVGRYLTKGELPLEVRHYPRVPAVRQKIAALAGRTEVQSRDVFDLFILTAGHMDSLDFALLRTELTDEILDEAKNRAWSMPYVEYEGKVLEFLEPKDRAEWAMQDRWAEQQIEVAELIDRIRRHASVDEAARVSMPPSAARPEIL
jgi:hypothetical protein